MLSIVWCLLTPVSHIELEVVETLRGEIKQKTANSLRISGLFCGVTDIAGICIVAWFPNIYIQYEGG